MFYKPLILFITFEKWKQQKNKMLKNTYCSLKVLVFDRRSCHGVAQTVGVACRKFSTSVKTIFEIVKTKSFQN